VRWRREVVNIRLTDAAGTRTYLRCSKLQARLERVQHLDTVADGNLDTAAADTRSGERG
jgi:hypothetical protein